MSYYEFAYFCENENTPLKDDIKIVKNESDDEFLVSNSPKLNAKIYAKEIDFYLKNTLDDALEKATNVSLIYEMYALIFASSVNDDFLSYNQKTCLFHKKRDVVCLKCLQNCPQNAIIADKEKKLLAFIESQCIKCAKCVNVCPSGSLDFAFLHKKSFLQIAKNFKNKIALIIAKDMPLNDIVLPKNVLPFIIESDFIDEFRVLTLLQQSGASVVFYAKKNEFSHEIEHFINEIYALKFKQKALFLCEDENELKNALNETCLIENSYFNINDINLSKRHAISKRLQFLIENEDFGVINTDLSYANIKIDTSKCTLCLSCAGACNGDAIKIDKNLNALIFNASLCNGCEYCKISCAEDCIEIKNGQLALNPTSFSYQIMAQDELFKCIECGKEFATKKAVEKIAKMFENQYFHDKIKLKTLFCCGDCKAKIMATQIYEQEKIKMENGI